MISASRPSNIAIVKYRGKDPDRHQIPMNPSISLTLTHCRTIMDMDVAENTDTSETSPNLSVTCMFAGTVNEAFGKKITDYFRSLRDQFPWVIGKDITITSDNTFPHSSGIASSASAFATLADLLIQWQDIYGDKTKETEHSKKSQPSQASLHSSIARQWSGSACRSIRPWRVLWPIWESAEPITDIHPSMRHVHDHIVIIDSGAKQTSSSAGHSLMHDNPYAPARYQRAHDRTEQALTALSSWDRSTLGQIIEREALDLHAMMMASDDGVLLRQPRTIQLIHDLRARRASSSVPVFFTIDAGANVHLLFPDSAYEHANTWISDWSQREGVEVIRDEGRMGG